MTYGTLVSVFAVVAGAWTERTSRYRAEKGSLLHFQYRCHLAVLLLFAFLENLGYRQIVLWWRIRGIWDYYFGQMGWEKFERKEFGKVTEQPAKEGG